MKKLVLLPIAIILFGCSSTHIVESWKAPNETITQGQFEKVMIAIFVRDEATRRYCEDRMAKEHDNFYPSYNYFETRDLVEDEEYCKKRLNQEGFDGIVTMQLVDIQESENFVPATYNGGYWGYAGMAYGGYYSPGYITVDQSYVIRTNLFSLKEDKLLWSGTTSTINPTSLDLTLEEITAELTKRMMKDGFMTKN